MYRQLSPETKSAAWLGWQMVELLVRQLMGAHGARITFLPRRACQRLARALNAIEPLLRRILYLMASELGALPAAPKPIRAKKSTKTSACDDPKTSRKPFFRLSDPALRPDQSAPPSPFRGGPRIRFLDEDDTPTLADFPPKPDDMLPAITLGRRLSALADVLERPQHYITAMQRRLRERDTLHYWTVPPARLPQPLDQFTCTYIFNGARDCIPYDTS